MADPHLAPVDDVAPAGEVQRDVDPKGVDLEQPVDIAGRLEHEAGRVGVGDVVAERERGIGEGPVCPVGEPRAQHGHVTETGRDLDAAARSPRRRPSPHSRSRPWR